MNSATLHQLNTIKQDAQEGKFTMHGIALTNLIHTLIRGYAKYRNCSYAVDADNFSLADKRLVLSHYESAEWYEYACESETKTESLFTECKDHVQKLINDDCDYVFKQDMEEMRDAI